jgi:hypothetical protein
MSYSHRRHAVVSYIELLKSGLTPGRSSDQDA